MTPKYLTLVALPPVSGAHIKPYFSTHPPGVVERIASAIAPSEVPDDVFLRSELRLGELQTLVLTLGFERFCFFQ